MFLNVTNHPSELWPPAQTAAALQYGEILDLPFPAVPPEWDIRKVAALADTLADDILRLRPAAVLCQGEMTLTYQLVNRLHAAGIPALCACTERRTEETRLPTGETKKISVFEFRGFRRYV